MRIQAYLTASAVNLKRLAATLFALWWALARLAESCAHCLAAEPA